MWNTVAIYWDAELASHRDRLTEDFRRAGGHRGSPAGRRQAGARTATPATRIAPVGAGAVWRPWGSHDLAR